MGTNDPNETAAELELGAARLAMVAHILTTRTIDGLNAQSIILSRVDWNSVTPDHREADALGLLSPEAATVLFNILSAAMPEALAAADRVTIERGTPCMTDPPPPPCSIRTGLDGEVRP